MRLTAKIWSAPVIIYALMIVIDNIYNWLTTGTPDPYMVKDVPFIEFLPPIFLLTAIIGLAIAWKWEKIGAIINMLFCIITIPVLFIHWPIMEDARFVMPYIVLLVIFIPGLLFFLASKANPKH